MVIGSGTPMLELRGVSKRFGAVVALRDGEYGGMVLPECKLTVGAIAQAGKEPVPVGQLWMLRLAPLNDGQVVQQGTPLELLTQPATSFVRDFFGGSDMGIRLLSLCEVGSLTRRGEPYSGSQPPLTENMNLSQALSAFVAQQVQQLPVVDEQGQPLGVLHFADLTAPRSGA